MAIFLRGFKSMRALIVLAACVGTLAGATAVAQPNTAASAANVDEARLMAADREPGQWLSPGRDHSEQRFSPLSQINDRNVAQMGLAWFADFDTRRGQESTPLVIDGVLYVTTAWSKVYAYDAKTGRQLWKYDPKVPGEWGVNACCDVVNRGLAAWKGKVYLGTLDGRLIAINATTGQEKWSTQTTPRDRPYSITGAPRVADGRVFVGQAGSEFEQRGFMAAYDAETGKQLWKWWVVPGDPKAGFEQPELKKAARTWKGEWWKTGGGGGPWDGIAYDPETRYLIFGTGNGAPWPLSIRSPGSLEHNENLFLSSMVAVKADTGQYVWHYQMTPSESWDYDATQQITLADLIFRGQRHRAAMQANKNGLFYIVDVRTGKLLSGKEYVPNVNWYLGFDPRTDKPRLNPAAIYTEDKGFVATPTYAGAHNWHPMSLNPITGLVYIPAMDGSYPYVATRDDDNPMGQKLSISFRKGMALPGTQPITSHLLAWNPLAGKEVWRVPLPTGRGGGTLATAGNLVFQGNSKEFVAYRATTGEKLWSMSAQTGVVAGAVSYSIDGEQYVAVAAGSRSGVTENYYSPNGSRILAFKLGATARLPDPPPPVVQVLDPPEPFGTPEMLTRGADTYNRFCGTCHGTDGESRGMFPDLRYSAMLRSPEAFNAVVLGGALTENGMVSFRQALQPEQVESIRAYMISRAIDLKLHPPAPPPGAPGPAPATAGEGAASHAKPTAPAAH
jgi:alcohol dehydrogenase (cytochrome c)/quinohemoprotein ethanol dehydrogenase